MKRALDDIIDKIIEEFQIGSKESFEVVKQFCNGFSGAEVYHVILGKESKRKGHYFLKIDTHNREFENSNKKCCFSKAAQYLDKRKIGDYYVILMSLAGNSDIEFDAFYNLSRPGERRECIENFLPDLLNDSTEKENMVGDQVSPVQLFLKFLPDRLERKYNLYLYMKDVFAKENIDKVPLIKLDKMILPNALAYALNENLWSHKFRIMKSKIHGDLHGDNLFVSKSRKQYALIDLALYNTDGYLFYDTAYFELSVMLKDLNEMPVIDWLNCISIIAEEKWDDAEFKGTLAIKTIQEEEKKWISRMYDDDFSYNDELYEARYIARVMAGLNYASKRAVSNDIRIKAFIYASEYLKKDLEKYDKFESDNKEFTEWFPTNTIDMEKEKSETVEMLDFINHFSGDQSYILLIGDGEKYSRAVNTNLARVPWMGIISLGQNEEMKNDVGSLRMIKIIYEGMNDYDTILGGNSSWWLYADGIQSIPETLSEKFADWRNKNIRFLEEYIMRLGTIVAPNEITLIIDAKSLLRSRKHLQRLMESFDILSDIQINAVVLNQRPEPLLDIESFSNILVKQYKLSLENLAIYCNKYMKEISQSEIVIPSENRLGVCLDEDDIKYIESNVEIVYDDIIDSENINDIRDKNNFFQGEPISWTAISEKLYIERKEIQYNINKVRDSILNEKYSIINIFHKPGAGASVISRVVCWNLRNEFPTIVVDRVDESITESLKRLSSLSGKHLLILLDGDYHKNDVQQLLGILKGNRIKACVLFPCRNYENHNNDALDILEYEESLDFLEKYSIKMTELMSYSQDECNRRKENMKSLSNDNNLIEFRLPFFYGMYAFEEDFKGIAQYIDNVLVNMDSDMKLQKLINYISIISYYSVNHGLNFKYAEKILNKNEKSARKLLNELNNKFHNLIYVEKSSYRLCHPIVAHNLLLKQFNLKSEAFTNLILNFIKDLKKYDGNLGISENLNTLFMDIFIKRDTEGAIELDSQKKNFSQIILDLENINLQEEIFKELVTVFPENAHFLQHYGRFLITNYPENLVSAKKYFDNAIELDSKNPTHFHARGDMYLKYIRYMINNHYRGITAEELYNKVMQPVDAALKDFKVAISYIKSNPERIDGLIYPYASIIQISTYVVTQLINRSNQRKHYKEFLNKNNKMSKWCESIISMARAYDMDTESRYDYIKENKFYMGTRNYLTKFRFDQEELLEQLEKKPDNVNLKRTYISIVDTEKHTWDSKSQEELKNIYLYCEDIIRTDLDITEGFLWKWFQAYIRIRNFSYAHMMGMIETLDNLENNLTANFILYVVYFCRYMKNKNQEDAQKSYHYIGECKRLSRNDPKQTYTQLYYTGQENCPISFDRKGSKIEGTVIGDCKNSQSEYLTLNCFPKFKAFFVPVHTQLKKDQSMGVLVRSFIGFSYDGLRAWEVDII